MIVVPKSFYMLVDYLENIRYLIFNTVYSNMENKICLPINSAPSSMSSFCSISFMFNSIQFDSLFEYFNIVLERSYSSAFFKRSTRISYKYKSNSCFFMYFSGKILLLFVLSYFLLIIIIYFMYDFIISNS